LILQQFRRSSCWRLALAAKSALIPHAIRSAPTKGITYPIAKQIAKPIDSPKMGQRQQRLNKPTAESVIPAMIQNFGLVTIFFSRVTPAPKTAGSEIPSLSFFSPIDNVIISQFGKFVCDCQ
jgi:hypothetical protein